jgi:heterodisulfide reductase subunit A
MRLHNGQTAVHELIHEEEKPVMLDNNKIGSVMIVGGGVTGMQAALDLADSGYYVYLIEKSGAIGGAMAQLDKTFPTNDCSM